MHRRKFSREYKVEAVKLAKVPGVAVTWAASDFDIHENVLRKWIKAHGRMWPIPFRSMAR